ncbi:MAG: HipA domain-containing protein, partial [Gammaproteobacteria bacterium]|nr:HipA domain-containing protein [Gammaproteobacteria bacterium]
IPDTGWDGRISLPTRKKVEGRTDIVLKFERPNYPGIVELESLTLNLHAKAGFEVPRHWVTEINGMPALAVERYDRNQQGKPVFTESLYSVLATGDSRITHHYSSSYDHIGYAIDRSPIPIVTDPMQSKQHLLKRLILSFLTGNGDLHLENLSLIQADHQIRFSPVYDPTPMRAYSRHDMLSVMPFGHYGEFDKTDRLIDYETALHGLCQNLSIKKTIFKSILDDALEITADYQTRLQNLKTLPAQNIQHLISVTETERKKVTKLLQNFQYR